ncbi:dTMP kinase [Streptomyces sp. NPDC059708]|uniref:dTMP kinase n=1 Tax=Streptomyces sp. NPDC059708 TaxID=3346916 RepID=UPI0036B867AA
MNTPTHGRGTFVTLDGPGGVGKSTVTRLITEQLVTAGLAAHPTREPSDATLGKLARHGTELFRGRTMAHLIAADRYMHVDEEIRPALEQGRTVICDRYVASSLVLQVLDGVPHDVVWDMNRYALRPDLSVILTADPEVIEKRLTDRGAHSRYEREPGSTERECAGFRTAGSFLVGAGFQVLQLDATTTSAEDIARAIVTAIRVVRRGNA